MPITIEKVEEVKEELDKYCPHFAKYGVHRDTVEGEALSGRTWYRCTVCQRGEFRG